MREFPVGLSRRALLATAPAAWLSGCGGRRPMSIAQAVAGGWRAASDRARDRYRHPVRSLTFWGLKPGMTVVEFWPGAGWYTAILGPYLAASGGRLIEANLQLGDPAAEPQAGEAVEGFKRRIAARKDLYGAVTMTSFGPTSGPVAPAGGADLVLFARNIHNWMAAGIADKAFHDAFAALKPGGLLGVEEHRADPGGAPDLLAKDGYVQQAYVEQLGRDAGFVLEAESEINANPRDTKDHPFGVWTLPPTRLSAARGEKREGEGGRDDFDHSPYDAIGESDRMTLRFAKPR